MENTHHFWVDRPVLVTGASGLVGSWLVKTLLEKKARVVALIRDQDPQTELFRSKNSDKIAIVSGCLEEMSTLERAINDHEIETVFHLGAQTIVGSALRDPLATFEANIRGSYQLLEACRRQKNLVKRIVVASSDKAYGTSPILPYTEEMPLIGKHPYDVSKSCTDLLALTYSHTYGLPVVIARCGNIYGGGDLNWSRIVPGTIRNLLQGKAPEIRSDGTFSRDYIFVQDVVEAYLLLAQSAKREDVQGQAFNFGPNRPLTVLELVKQIQELMNRQDLKPEILSTAKAEIPHQSLSSKKAEKILGWKMQFTLEQGLTETIKWYESFLGVEATV